MGDPINVRTSERKRGRTMRRATRSIEACKDRASDHRQRKPKKDEERQLIEKE